MDDLDWARLDLAASVDLMAQRSLPLFTVGHTYSRHAFGVLRSHDRVARFIRLPPVPVGMVGCRLRSV